MKLNNKYLSFLLASVVAITAGAEQLNQINLVDKKPSTIVSADNYNDVDIDKFVLKTKQDDTPLPSSSELPLVEEPSSTQVEAIEQPPVEEPVTTEIVEEIVNDTTKQDIVVEEISQPQIAGSELVYSLTDFMQLGRINWGGYQWTYYSQQVLPGGGLDIPGRHVNEAGYVADADGYIVLAAPDSWGNVKHQVFPTPFGYMGKVYDVNAGGNALDVYIQ